MRVAVLDDDAASAGEVGLFSDGSSQVHVLELGIHEDVLARLHIDPHPNHEFGVAFDQVHQADGTGCRLAPAALPRRAPRTWVTSSKKRAVSRVAAARGCGRSTSIAALIVPGRALITRTRVE